MHEYLPVPHYSLKSPEFSSVAINTVVGSQLSLACPRHSPCGVTLGLRRSEMTDSTTKKRWRADPALLCIPLSPGASPPSSDRVVSVSFSAFGLMFAFYFTTAQVVWKHPAYGLSLIFKKLFWLSWHFPHSYATSAWALHRSQLISV